MRQECRVRGKDHVPHSAGLFQQQLQLTGNPPRSATSSYSHNRAKSWQRNTSQSFGHIPFASEISGASCSALLAAACLTLPAPLAPPHSTGLDRRDSMPSPSVSCLKSWGYLLSHEHVCNFSVFPIWLMRIYSVWLGVEEGCLVSTPLF